MKILILSDPHYASDGEKARGSYEPRVVPPGPLRLLVRAYRHFVWMRNPFGSNVLLERFLAEAGPADWVVVNGDLSCDSAFVGVSDDAAFASARLCLQSLRQQYGDRLLTVIGDHELGKMSIFGGVGGPRLASWERAVEALRLTPCWRQDLGCYTLLAVTSSLVALPVFAPELLPDERSVWERLRKEHLQELERMMATLPSGQRIILFSHDPTALPFLAQEPFIQRRLGQIERTIIGHLHSETMLWKTRWLSGLPPITFLGNTVRRYSAALARAKAWKPFQVRLCPALAGVEWRKDGGWLELELDPAGRTPCEFRFRPLRRG